MKNRFCKAVFCAILAFAAFGGTPMSPEEIEELMATMNRPKIAHTLPESTDNGDDLIRKLLAGR